MVTFRIIATCKGVEREGIAREGQNDHFKDNNFLHGVYMEVHFIAILYTSHMLKIKIQIRVLPLLRSTIFDTSCTFKFHYL